MYVSAQKAQPFLTGLQMQKAMPSRRASVDAHTIMGNLLMYEGTLDEAEAELNIALRRHDQGIKDT